MIWNTFTTVHFLRLILDSSVGLSADIQSAGDSVLETLVRFLHSTEEDNLSPFDWKIACLYQSIGIENNKHDCTFSRHIGQIFVCVFTKQQQISDNFSHENAFWVNICKSDVTATLFQRGGGWGRGWGWGGGGGCLARYEGHYSALCGVISNIIPGRSWSYIKAWPVQTQNQQTPDRRSCVPRYRSSGQ